MISGMLTREGLEAFGLQRQPFGAGKQGGAFYSGPQHRDALSFLERALHSNDLLLALTGESGVGKSLTMERALKETLPGALLATLGNLSTGPDDFLVALLKGFGFEGVSASREEMRGLLTVYLGYQRQKGVTTVIVADEPEVVSGGVIEEVGWLSLLEPVRLGRLKLVLLGSELLERQLAAPRMHALRQMIRWQHRLEALGPAETLDYLEFQLECAGCPRPGKVFAPEAVERIHAHSGGLPQRINQIALGALETAAEAGEASVQGNRVEAVSGATLGKARRGTKPVASMDILFEDEPRARIRLTSPRLLIGRHPWNDVQLDYDSVSRHHAMLVREAGHWTVVDLNSANGVHVNDRRVRQQRLNHGDVVQIGRFRLILNEGSGPPRDLPAAGDFGATMVVPSPG
ncbi:MAG: FHA domain-containing protein [Gammaproteobacteria bacterium]